MKSIIIKKDYNVMNNFINPFDPICNDYAHRFDNLSDNNDVQNVIRLLSEVENFLSSHEDAIYAPLYYSLGTSYGNLRNFGYSFKSQNDNNEVSFEEIDISLEKEIYYFRHCLELLDDSKLDMKKYKPYVNGLKLNVYTNLANTLESCCRKSAAMKYYRKALDIQSSFGMAEGNIGRTLQHYSILIHDKGHRDFLHYFAYRFLKSSLKRENVHYSARMYFEECIKIYSEDFIKSFLEKELTIKEYSLGDIDEKEYRKWCLHYHLFLNPLNDLPQEHSCFATDSLQLPNITTSIEQIEPPKYFGMFNQLKQEYIYARYLCYEAFKGPQRAHFADKETYLTNLFDYPQYSIRIEGLKTAFRQLYSLFDKGAFFINEYWDIGVHEHDINYRTIWLTNYGYGKKNYKYKNPLNLDNNIALKSMFWIHKEFNKKFGDADEPYAQNMKVLRNALEHKFVKVHADFFDFKCSKNQKLEQDSFYHIMENDLLKYTMDLLEIVREWLIDLTMAIHIEETNNNEHDEKNIVSMNLYEFQDEWKI